MFCDRNVSWSSHACNSIDTLLDFHLILTANTFGGKISFMSSNKIDRPPKPGKKSRTRAPKNPITPDQLLSDINEQTEALNKIIKKFSEPPAEVEKPKRLKNKGKSKNK